MSDGLIWAEYWAEEEAAFAQEREIEAELDRQSRQIRYEADCRRGFPLGGYSAPLHRDMIRK